MEPGSGAACSVKEDRFAVHVTPQSIPAGVVVTVPVPDPDLTIVRGPVSAMASGNITQTSDERISPRTPRVTELRKVMIFGKCAAQCSGRCADHRNDHVGNEPNLTLCIEVDRKNKEGQRFLFLKSIPPIDPFYLFNSRNPNREPSEDMSGVPTRTTSHNSPSHNAGSRYTPIAFPERECQRHTHTP